MKQTLNPGATPQAPYSRAVSAGGLIYLSGTIAQDATGNVVSADVAGQTQHVLERMGELLTAAGSSLGQVLSVTVYLTSASNFQAMNDAYRPFFPNDPPTRTTVITELVKPGALVEISMIAAPAGAERAVIHPEGWAHSPNPYSYAVRSGDTVFLSGLVPRRGRDNSAVRGDIAVQTRAIFENASELLAAAGLSLADVVAARVYLTDAAQFAAMNAVYREQFPGGFPARATVKSGLAGRDFTIEITFTASSAPKERIGSPPEGVPISPAVRAGRRLYLSGMLGNTPEAGGDVVAQTRETFARIGRTLDTAGVSRKDVVDAVVYLKDVRSFQAMNEVYREFFGGEFPARTTVGTPLVVDDGLVEIMVAAVVP